MSDQAFSKIYPLAGFEFPAVRQTLHHFLTLSQNNLIDREELVAAIELDPSLLAVFLSTSENSDLSNWHLGADQKYFKQVALTLGNQFASRDISEVAKRYFYSQWRRSLLHSNLCGEFANLVSEDVTTLRLLGLMAGLGHHFFAKAYGDTYFPMLTEASSPALLVRAEQEQFGLGGNELGARLFKSWGYSSNQADALRYQYAELNELQDATQVVKIVAYTKRLIDLVRFSGIPDPELVIVGAKLFDISDAAVSDIVTRGDLIFSKTQKKMFSDENSVNLFRTDLANANMAVAVENSLSLGAQSITRTANLVFGINSTLFFKVKDDKLQAKLADGEVLSVACGSGRSQLALSYQQDKFITAEEEVLASIVDKQLLDRLEASAIWFLPLGREIGVLVCGMTQNRETEAPLLDSFRLAASEQLGLMLQDQVPVLDAEFVRKRVSEITHEVNNPLAIVQNYLRTLSLKLDEGSPVHADIETISSEMMRVAGIVQKYSEIGRQHDLLTQEINVNEILTALAGVFRGGYGAVSFEMKLDKAMPLVAITLDSFKQVIVNIVKNAVEALHETKDAKVIISSHGSINLSGQQYIEVQISDNGPGIPLPVREKLFQPHNSGKGEGHSGLGLSIVKQLVTQMEGLVSCKSQIVGDEPPGTIFQILIPLINSQE